MKVRRRPVRAPDPLVASSLCQVVNGSQGGCSSECGSPRPCDCIHTTRCSAVGEMWYVSVDDFTGIAVTYSPVVDPETGHEIITLPELAVLI